MSNSDDVFEQEDVLESLNSLEEDESSIHLHWKYCVVINEHVEGVEAGIYEVYFNDAGEPISWIPNPSGIGFDEESLDKSVSELRDDMECMLLAFQNETYSLVVEGEDESLEVIS